MRFNHLTWHTETNDELVNSVSERKAGSISKDCEQFLHSMPRPIDGPKSYIFICVGAAIRI